MAEQKSAGLRFSAAPRQIGPTFLLWLLLGLSWIATFSGLYDFIRSYDDLDWPRTIAVGVFIAALQGMIYSALKALFSHKYGWFRWTFSLGLYLFLTLLSMVFSFGFFWKLLSAHLETTASAETSLTQVETDLNRAKFRLDSLRGTLDRLASTSKAKADQERTVGGTCAGASGPGPRARARLRQSDADNFSNIKSHLDKPIEGIEKSLTKLRLEFQKVSKNDPSMIDAATGTRVPFMMGLRKELNTTISQINNFSDDRFLQETKRHLVDRAATTQFSDERGGQFSCPDSALKNLLETAAKEIEDLPKVESITLEVSEGARAVSEAINRLRNTASALVREQKLPASAAEIRRQKQDNRAADETKAGLGNDDVLPLFLAIFVDLCIFGAAVWAGREEPIVNNDDFIDLINKAYQSAFNAQPTDAQRINPLRSIIFSRFGDHYGAVPLNFGDSDPGSDDFGQIAKTTSGKLASEWNRDDSHFAAQARYIDYAFVGFEAAGFVTRVKFWRRLLNGLTENAIRKKLEKQNSDFSEARDFDLYLFKRAAWNDVIVRIMRTAGALRPVLGSTEVIGWRARRKARIAPSQSRTANSSDRRKDEFPAGVEVERE